ncbi:MAG: hypothetical protein U0P28_06170 [Ruminococcus sp.]|nr:hypothetical protein [uncultured Ruminococcus sp.]MBQ1350930.1 hypothetical protein [Ruminococcus sp.]MBQ1615616.1 hypothetical protein [Ruminococcus sp.]
MNSLLFGLVYGLSVTLVTELSVAALLRVRGWDLVLIGLVNCLTNPVVNLIYAWSLLNFSQNSAVPYLVLAALEIAVVFGEAWAFRVTLKYRRIRPLLLSLILNGVSFSVGLILNILF